MRIPRPLAHRLLSKLQIVLSQIELGKSKDAIKSIHELSDLITSNLETDEDEREREQRESTRDR